MKKLIRARKISSTAAVTAADGIPEVERLAVMKAIIETMRSHGDWLEMPDGIHGALILAERAPEGAVDLAAFIRRANPESIPPWLNTLIRDKPWFNKGKAK